MFVPILELEKNAVSFSNSSFIYEKRVDLSNVCIGSLLIYSIYLYFWYVFIYYLQKNSIINCS